MKAHGSRDEAHRRNEPSLSRWPLLCRPGTTPRQAGPSRSRRRPSRCRIARPSASKDPAACARAPNEAPANVPPPPLPPLGPVGGSESLTAAREGRVRRVRGTFGRRGPCGGGRAGSTPPAPQCAPALAREKAHERTSTSQSNDVVSPNRFICSLTLQHLFVTCQMPLTRASINAAQLPIPVFTLGKAFDEVQYSLISQDIRRLIYEFKIVMSPCYCLKAI